MFFRDRQLRHDVTEKKARAQINRKMYVRMRVKSRVCLGRRIEEWKDGRMEVRRMRWPYSANLREYFVKINTGRYN